MARSKVTIVGLYNYDDSLFDNMLLPDGIDRGNLIYNILERAGDFALLYPDFDFMKMMIGVWSKNCYVVITKLLRTTQVEYDPIENYNRRGEISRQASGQSNSNSKNAQTAFDSIEFRDTDRQESAGTSAATEAVTEHLHGNIGVTTTQQMIEQERKVSTYNIYDVVTRDFINRFCIELY